MLLRIEGGTKGGCALRLQGTHALRERGDIARRRRFMHNNSAAQLLEREDDAIADSGQVNSHSAQQACVSHEHTSASMAYDRV